MCYYIGMMNHRERSTLICDLAFRPQGVTASEVAEQAGCHYTVAQRHLAALASQGYINIGKPTPGRRQYGRPPTVYNAPFKIAFDKLPKGSVKFVGNKVFIRLTSLLELTGGTVPTGGAS